jgi:BolA family transcriptional regulator, general stress-responsive regulator
MSLGPPAPAAYLRHRPVAGDGGLSLSVAEQLADRLRQGLSPTHLDVVDFSAAHAGHAGARAGGESHFSVTVVAEAFAGRSRLERQRLVYGAAADLMQETVHALTITAFTPAEYATRGHSAAAGRPASGNATAPLAPRGGAA